jgi:glyoxylate/hydroxypyruvate reductase A
MKILLAGDIDSDELHGWRVALSQAMPEALWFDAAAARVVASDIEAAVVANPQPGSLRGLPGLRLIQSLWAGVDRLLADVTLPADVPLARMVDPTMSAAMAETALWATLSLHRGFFAYARRQHEGRWQQHGQRRADEVRVGVLGLGRMGRAVVERLLAQGYPVAAWVREPHGRGEPAPTGAAVFVGDAGLASLLPAADILINLLPLTDATRGLLDARLFAALPVAAGLINLGRGGHLVDADLLDALASGHLRHAVLDVFHTEPLPAGHPFWAHPRVTVLPHAAALTDPRSAAAVAVTNLRALRDGQPLAHLVDRRRGY